MDWELVFSQSKVNGGEYYGNLLVAQPWDWPRDTWLQWRLKQVRSEENPREEPDDGLRCSGDSGCHG